MVNLLRMVWHALLIRPLMRGYWRLKVCHPDRVPRAGPAVIVANHNSHLDTLVLMSLVPMSKIARVRPVAAADYFCRNRWVEWFVTRVCGAIPVHRRLVADLGSDPMRSCTAALMRGDILILFPEGSRGAPGELGEMKRGLAHLLRTMPYVPITPVYLDGPDRCLPKGARIPRPYRCTAVVGRALQCTGDGSALLGALRKNLLSLQRQSASSELTAPY